MEKPKVYHYRSENKIVVGNCVGKYKNAVCEKEFEAKVLVSSRPDGTTIVHNLDDGIRPLCYIDGNSIVKLDRTVEDVSLRYSVTAEDGQELVLDFSEIIAEQGLEVEQSNKAIGLGMDILKCVFDLGGNYGRTTTAMILTGSVSKKILPINISKLGTYGVAKKVSTKEVLSLIDWLIHESYLAYVEDSELPVLVVTSKGLDVLGDGELMSKKDE